MKIDPLYDNINKNYDNDNKGLEFFSNNFFHIKKFIEKKENENVHMSKIENSQKEEELNHKRNNLNSSGKTEKLEKFLGLYKENNEAMDFYKSVLIEENNSMNISKNKINKNNIIDDRSWFNKESNSSEICGANKDKRITNLINAEVEFIFSKLDK